MDQLALYRKKQHEKFLQLNATQTSQPVKKDQETEKEPLKTEKVEKEPVKTNLKVEKQPDAETSSKIIPESKESCKPVQNNSLEKSPGVVKSTLNEKVKPGTEIICDGDVCRIVKKKEEKKVEFERASSRIIKMYKKKNDKEKDSE